MLVKDLIQRIGTTPPFPWIKSDCLLLFQHCLTPMSLALPTKCDKGLLPFKKSALMLVKVL